MKKSFDIFSLKNAFFGTILLFCLLLLSKLVSKQIDIPAWVSFFTVTPAVLVGSYVLQIRKFSNEKILLQQNEKLKLQIEGYEKAVQTQEYYLDTAEVKVRELNETISEKENKIKKLNSDLEEQIALVDEIRENANQNIASHARAVNEYEIALKRENDKLKESTKLLSQAQEVINKLNERESQFIILQEKVKRLEEELGKAKPYEIFWEDEPEQVKDLIDLLERRKKMSISLTNAYNPVLGRLKKELND